MTSRIPRSNRIASTRLYRLSNLYLNVRSLVLAAFALAFTTPASAQSFYALSHDRDMLITAGIGTASYYGELSSPTDYLDTKPALSLGLTVYPLPYFIGNRVAVTSELSYFRLQGSDKDATTSRVIRNLSFFSDNLELTLAGNLHLLPVNQPLVKNSVFNIYGVIGVGMLWSNPKTRYNGTAVALQPLRTEGVDYSRLNLVIPMGFGVKVLQNHNFHIALEATWRKTFTDYLDDASSRYYANPASLSSDLARALADRRGEYYAQQGKTFAPKGERDGVRGNPDADDSYLLFTVKAAYYLPVRLKDMNKKLMIIRSKKAKSR